MNKVSLTKYNLDVNEILSMLDSVPVEWKDQLAVTSRSGNDLLDGIGSINEYPATEERDFCKLNSFFKGSSIEKVLNSLYADGYSHGRVRIMRMGPKSTYTYHMDCETRLHFALKTTPKAMFIIDDEVFRVPADGQGYIINTTSLHTAVNASLESRIHIVFDLLIPVSKATSPAGITYHLLNKSLNQDEFNAWLIETKPHTEPQRQDFYFV